MNGFVPLNKQSKKKQKEFHAAQRRTWGVLNPVSKSVPSGKAYNRKKLRAKDKRDSRSFRDEMPAVFLSAKNESYSDYIPWLPDRPYPAGLPSDH